MMMRRRRRMMMMRIVMMIVMVVTDPLSLRKARESVPDASCREAIVLA
jgi:hypothetical protein